MRILISYAIQLFCLSCRARVGLLTTMSCGTRTISQLMGFSLWRTISAIHTRGAPVLSQWVSWDIFGPDNPWQIKTVILPVKLRYIWQWCCFLFFLVWTNSSSGLLCTFGCIPSEILSGTGFGGKREWWWQGDKSRWRIGCASSTGPQRKCKKSDVLLLKSEQKMK